MAGTRRQRVTSDVQHGGIQLYRLDPEIRTLISMERGATGGEPTGSVEMSQERPNTAFIDHAVPSESGPVYQFQGHRQSFAEQNDASAGGLTDDRTAVSALMQLQGTTGQTTYQTCDAIRVTEGNQLTNHTPDMTNFYNHSKLYQSRSDTGMQFQLPAHNRTQTYPTFSGNTDCSGSSTQDAVTNLNNEFSNMQQQQALMSERQESISNALCNLTSMLQDMRDGSRSHNLNTNSTVSGLEARASLPNGRQQGQGTFDTGLSANPDSYENGDYMVSERQTLQDSRLSQLRDCYFQDILHVLMITYSNRDGQKTDPCLTLGEKDTTKDHRR